MLIYLAAEVRNQAKCSSASLYYETVMEFLSAGTEFCNIIWRNFKLAEVSLRHGVWIRMS